MVQILPQRDLSFILGEAIGGGFSQGLAERIASFKQQQEDQEKILRQQQEDQEKMSRLEEAGFTPEQAELFSLLPTGAQTELSRHIFEAQERGEGPLPFEGGFVPREEKIEIDTPEERTIATIDKGLTKKEKVARQNERYTKNLPLFQEHRKKKEAQELEGMKIQQLQTLNEAGGLPSGAGRWNVTIQEGNLRIPALSSPEAQLFVKTVNDFLVGAKDTFGARVTNFEIQRFMKRLPTLANTEEGRRAILRQMEIINQINQLHHEGILNTFDKAGGIRNVDYDQTVRFAKRDTKEKEEELKQEFQNISKELRKIPTIKVKKDTILMRDPSGALRRVSKKDVKAARKEGYKLSK